MKRIEIPKDELKKLYKDQKLSSMRKKFYLTIAIPYVNAPPHLGHALEFIQGDVIARYHRLLGEDVKYLTGSDENAIKNVLAAEKAGLSPQPFCDQMTKLFQKLGEKLDISFDIWQRGSDKELHWPGVKKIWNFSVEAGDIYKKPYQGKYCVGCESFKMEKDLVDGLCPEHGTKPQLVSEENYFFKLSKYQDQILDLIETDKLRVIPQKRKNEILSFIKEGLEDFSISRSKERARGWGIPVPGDDEQYIYTWFDALIIYLTGVGFSRDEKEFNKWWPADLQIIGKDIIRFHAVYWLAMLLSLELPLPKQLLVHGFITSGGRKMSKSIGNVIDPLELVKKYGIDPIRYFLLREISPTEDGDFTYERFEERYNSDLADGLGNLLSRILTMAEKVLPEGTEYAPDAEFENLFRQVSGELRKSMDEFRFNDALGVIWKLIGYCDRYVEKKRPWETKDVQVLKNLLAALMTIALLLKPFLSVTPDKIFNQLGVDPEGKKPWRFRIKKGDPLFPRFPF